MGYEPSRDPDEDSNHEVAANFGTFMLSDEARCELFGTMLKRAFAGQEPLTSDEMEKLEPEWIQWNEWVSEWLSEMMAGNEESFDEWRDKKTEAGEVNNR